MRGKRHSFKLLVVGKKNNNTPKPHSQIFKCPAYLQHFGDDWIAFQQFSGKGKKSRRCQGEKKTEERTHAFGFHNAKLESFVKRGKVSFPSRQNWAFWWSLICDKSLLGINPSIFSFLLHFNLLIYPKEKTVQTLEVLCFVHYREQKKAENTGKIISIPGKKYAHKLPLLPISVIKINQESSVLLQVQQWTLAKLTNSRQKIKIKNLQISEYL